MKKLILLPFLFIALFISQSVFAQDIQDPSPMFCLGGTCSASISPSVPLSSAPSPTIFIGSPSLSPSASISAQPSGEEATPSASPAVSPSPSVSGTPSNPAGPICTSFNQFINNLSSGNSTLNEKVHIKCGSGGGGGKGSKGNTGSNPNNGLISQLLSLIIQLLLQLLQLCGVQPINGTPAPSGSPLPSLSLSLAPSGTVPSKQATSPSAKPSQAQNQPSQSQTQPSQGQPNPSQSQTKPSQAQNQPSQSQTQPSQGQPNPSQSQTKPSQAQSPQVSPSSAPKPPAKWAYLAPTGLTDKNVTATGVTVSWNKVTGSSPTVTGGVPAPKSYTVAVYNSSDTLIKETTTTGTSYTETGLPSDSTVTIHVWANGGPVAPPHASIMVNLSTGTSTTTKWAYLAPTGLKVTSHTTTSVSLSWNTVTGSSPTVPGGVPKPSSYTIAAYNHGKGTTLKQTTSTTTSATVSGLTAGSEIDIHVWANGGPVAPPHASVSVSLETGVSTACSVPNVGKGTCQDTNITSPGSGKYYPGYCPGPSNVQCLVP